MKVTFQPILNESEYDSALEEIATLMNAGANTSEGARLEVLVTLVRAYEAGNWAIHAPDRIAEHMPDSKSPRAN